MKNALLFLMLCLYLPLLHASVGGTETLYSIKVDVGDRPTLQRGAKLFMNYCSGCHSLKYLRYSRLATDLGLTTFDGEVDKDLLFSNLVFTKAKLGEPIQVSMPPEAAVQWFGVVPPDLSLSARQYGASWLYTYLMSFYADASRPFGANNLLKPDVAMPNVLEPLSGWVVGVNAGGEITNHNVARLLRVRAGEMNAREFESAVKDLVTFLVYVGEPVQMIRYRIGFGVLLFLAVLLLVVYRLKKVYWRKIH